jgi:hypothetical protein
VSVWGLSYVLSVADRLSMSGAKRNGAIAAARLALVLEPAVDPRPMVKSAIREALSDAAAIALVLQTALALLDGERDALTDEQEALIRSLLDHQPRPVVLLGVVELAEQLVAQIVGPSGREQVALAVVDERGHGDSPSVGRGGVATAASAGSSACMPATNAPTVGVPTDASAESSPSSVGASVVPVCLLRERAEVRDLLRGDLRSMIQAAGGLHVDEVAERLIELGWRRA